MKIRLLAPALDEITEAAIWFDNQRVGLGDAFWQAVEAVLQRIGEFFGIREERIRDIRCGHSLRRRAAI